MARQGSISETLFRHWQMLRLIPRAPRRIDTATLERLLEDEGIHVHRRSIQRDLESLATTFTALVCDDRTKPYGWSWERDAPVLEVPGMSVAAAVTLDLVRVYLAQTLPRTTLGALGPYFDRAKETLARSGGARLARWPRKVRVVPRGQPLQPPDVAAPVLDAVYSALLQERQLRARYRPRASAADKKYDINPLGLVVRNGALVLVCTFWDYDDVNQVLLHRMSRAELLSSPARTPRGFDLDEHIASGGIAFRKGGQLSLRARLDPGVTVTLSETPIARDQTIAPGKDGRDLLEATVPDTLELRGWIASYGPLIEVLGPKALRQEFAEAARQLAGLYSTG
jgi:predicted DNA-binding transcriptional regulator YafY